VVLLSLVPYAVLLLGTFWMRGAWARGIHALLWTAFQFAIFVDTRIFNLFRYHFNGMVWNVLVRPDTGDSVQFSFSDWSQLSLGLAGLAVVQFLAATWGCAWRRRSSTASRVTRMRSRTPGWRSSS